MQRTNHIIILICLLVFFACSLSIIQAQNIIYTIQKGDNLIQIAEKYNCSLEKIIKLNKINNPNKITIGDKLRIPSSMKKYIVKKGDTLTKIAETYNISIENLTSTNEIKDPDKIIIGHNLTIPTNNKMNQTYRVMSRNNNLHFIWPIQGRISSEFGWREHPLTQERDYHRGLDIAVSTGSPVYSAEKGIVTYSGWSKGYGRLIIIQHRNNTKTYYAHNLRLLVKQGDKIRQGKIIALSGNSGVSTGPHLHFEVKVNNQSIDPLKYLNKHYLKIN
jgi:murein DD-endopeptidase MepM/ murein hydrolase activator NlpD